jgi:hypothetical protein
MEQILKILKFQQQLDSVFSIELLPEEIIEHIASSLGNKGVNYLRRTCRKFYQWILPPFLRIDKTEQYKRLSKKNWTYLSTLKMYKILLNVQQVKKILYCKNLKDLEMSVVCRSNANYCLNFDELQLLETMSGNFYIEDFEGILAIKGSPGLKSLKVEILRSNCKTFETSPDKHEKPIILNFLDCPKLKIW